MKMIDPAVIRRFFQTLNEADVTYVLIKNIDGELPEHLRYGKDIDLLVKSSDLPAYERAIAGMGFQYKPHPQSVAAGWKLLYGAEDCIMRKIPDSLEVDVHTSLCVKSLLGNLWIPLDRSIQTYLWAHRTWDEAQGWWQMDERTLTVYLLARCIFDKQAFPAPYRREIPHHVAMLDDPIVCDMLGKVFFRYAPRLVELVRAERFDDIVEDYLSFADY